MGIEFTVIPANERPERIRGPKPGGVTDLLLKGETLFVVSESNKFGGYSSALKRRGQRLITRQTTRDGQKGFVIWAEPRLSPPVEIKAK